MEYIIKVQIVGTWCTIMKCKDLEHAKKRLLEIRNGEEKFKNIGEGDYKIFSKEITYKMLDD